MATLRLMIPGPTRVPARVREAESQEMIHHRGTPFQAVLRRCREGIRELLGTNGEVLLMASSGRGAIEAAIVNLFSPGDRVLVGVNGHFGAMLAEIARLFGLEVVTVGGSWEKPVDPEAVATALVADPAIKGVLVVHCETSTGVENDIQALARVANAYGRLILVDAVSSVGCTEIRQTEWGIHAVVAASQKGLMCPAGLSLVSLDERAWPWVERSRFSKFYWDFRRLRMMAEKGPEMPYSAPVSLLRALDAALEMIREEGLPQVYARHQALGSAIRAALVTLGFSLYPPAAVRRAAGVTVAQVPTGLESRVIIERLKERGFLIAAGIGQTANQLVRIGHLGDIRPQDVLDLVSALERVIEELGRSVAIGSGVAAALQVLEGRSATGATPGGTSMAPV